MKDRIIIRHSEMTDLPRMKEIFNIARQFMIESGNPNQWVDGYPDEEFLREDIEHGDSYVILADGRIVATFVLRAGKDPTYDVVYDGEWLNDEPYATIHRIAASGEESGGGRPEQSDRSSAAFAARYLSFFLKLTAFPPGR